MNVPTMRMSNGDWAILALLTLIWGSSFWLIEIGLTGFGPVMLVFLRMAVAVPFMLVYLRMTGRRLPSDAMHWWRLTVLGMFNIALPMALFFWAQTRINSGLASILNATVPLWGVLVAHITTTDERATPGKVIGVAVGFFGIVIVIGFDALRELGSGAAAQIACLFATFCFAGAAVYGRRVAADMDTTTVATGQVITAAVLLFPAAMIIDTPWTAAAPNMSAMVAMIALASIATSFAYVLYFRLISSAGASNAMLIALAMPPVGILLGAFALGEQFSRNQAVGTILILVGLVIIDGRVPARLAPRRSVP